MAKILLVYPSMRLLGFRFPYSLIPLENYLSNKGHDVVLFDAQVENNLDFDPRGYDVVGFSILTGPQILSALELAGIVREHAPKALIVFGGVHATLLPEQTALHPLVDIVVRQEGEETMHQLSMAVANGRHYFDIDGLTWEENGEVVSTPDRPFIDLDASPFLNFNCLKIDKYIELKRDPKLLYMETSRGCPHKCAFCYDPVFHKRRWRAKSPERVVEEIKYVVSKYGIQQIFFTDDELAVSQKRLGRIAELMIKENIKVQWPIFSRANYVVNYDKDFLSLIKAAGCDWINFGVESGSERILKLINKQITIDQVINSVKILSESDFNIGLSFMIGFPSETIDEIQMTFELIDKVSALSNKMWIGQISAYTPLPGTALMQECEKFGFVQPQSLYEWGHYNYNDAKNLQYFEKDIYNIIRTMTILSKFDFASNELRSAGILENKLLFKLAYHTLCKMAQWRWRNKQFMWPLEWRFVDWALTKLNFGER